MNTLGFKRYSTPDALAAMVRKITGGNDPSADWRSITWNADEQIATPFGTFFRLVTTVYCGHQPDWRKLALPFQFDHVIPGLKHFDITSLDVGGIVTERHFMFASTNTYHGHVFAHDPERRLFGMTNHPVGDQNPLDIPHNVCYFVPPTHRDALVIGVDYAATGWLAQYNPLAGLVTRQVMRLAVNRICKHMECKYPSQPGRFLMPSLD